MNFIMRLTPNMSYRHKGESRVKIKTHAQNTVEKSNNLTFPRPKIMVRKAKFLTN